MSVPGSLKTWEHLTAVLFWKVLSDEVKRKQYDAYGSTGFDPGAGGSGQSYWKGGPTVDPEELFRKIFGEFSSSSFGDFQSVFSQPQEVSSF